MTTKKQHDKQRNRLATERRTHVASLFLEGYPQYEIAKKLNVSVATISRDLQALHTYWHEESIRRYDEIIREEVLKLDHIEHVAWLSFYESKREIQLTEKPGHGVVETVTEKGGDARFLKQVSDCVFKKIQLYGAARPGLKRNTTSSNAGDVVAPDPLFIEEAQDVVSDDKTLAEHSIDAMAKYLKDNKIALLDQKTDE